MEQAPWDTDGRFVSRGGAPFFRGLDGSRRVSVMGCEREPWALAMALGAGTVLMGVLTFSPVVIGVGFGIWTLATAALRRLHRHDPMFWRVYKRSRRYLPYYPGRSTRWARPVRKKR